MLAVKAKYQRGNVCWDSPPPLMDFCNLIVVFETEGSKALEPTENADEIDQAIQDIQRSYEDIPQSVSLVDELLAERRREALNE